MSETILINRLPTRTWNHLGVNETALSWAPAAEADDVRIVAAGQIERLDVSGDGASAERRIEIRAAEGQTVTVVETIRAEADLLVRTTIDAELGAQVRLVQIQRTGRDSRLRLETRGQCAENARIALTQILLGQGDVYSDGDLALNGDGAGLKAEIGYLGQRRQTVDMNLVVTHRGRRTTSEIHAAGALKDRAHKCFRGTIDFKRGAAGAVGNEQETVLMLGEGASNQTVPIILCAEENVEGNHGATIGELDEATRFYFESRGISAEAAENILARAAIERLARELPDERAREAVLAGLEEVL